MLSLACCSPKCFTTIFKFIKSQKRLPNIITLYLFNSNQNQIVSKLDLPIVLYALLHHFLHSPICLKKKKNT